VEVVARRGVDVWTLFCACADGDLDAVRRLVEKDPALVRAHFEYRTPLSFAVRDDHLEVASFLLESAAGRGHEEFVRLMLRHQPSLAPRVVVARPRHIAVLLFAHGMDPNRRTWMMATPLHHFARHDDVEGAELYLDHGAEIDARDYEFRSTPLGFAAMSGKLQMAEFLLQHGARPSLPDDPPWATPPAWATRRGHDEIVRLLTVGRA
jgi:ankyrin repeat protein